MANNESLQTEKNQKVEVTQQEFTTLIQQELAAGHITFSESPDNVLVKNFLENLPKMDHFAVAIKTGDKYSVFYPERNVTYDFDYVYQVDNEDALPFDKKTERIEDPILVIEDFKQFVTYLLAATQGATTAEKLGSKWTLSDKELPVTEGIWYNATPYDFVHPIEFLSLEQQIIAGAELKQTFGESKDGKKSELVGGEIEILLSGENSSYETPFALAPSIQVEYKGATISRELSKVRVGIYEEDGVKKAKLYAVQSSNELKNEYTRLQEELERQDSYIAEANEVYKTVYRKSPENFNKVFGHFPPEIFDIEDSTEFFVQFKAVLVQNLHKINENGHLYGMYFYQNILNSKFPRYKVEYDDDQNAINNLGNAIDRLRLFDGDTLEEKAEIIDEIGEIEAKLAVDKKIARQMKTSEVPPSQAASLALCLSALETIGVEEVMVPLYLPLRVKNHEARFGFSETEVMDSRKLNNLIDLLAYVSAQTSGVEIWQDPHMTEDGGSYLTLKISKMSSNKPILQEFIEAGIKSAQ